MCLHRKAVRRQSTVTRDVDGVGTVRHVALFVRVRGGRIVTTLLAQLPDSLAVYSAFSAITVSAPYGPIMISRLRPSLHVATTSPPSVPLSRHSPSGNSTLK